VRARLKPNPPEFLVNIRFPIPDTTGSPHRIIMELATGLFSSGVSPLGLLDGPLC
jgi:hypothetical protein